MKMLGEPTQVCLDCSITAGSPVAAQDLDEHGGHLILTLARPAVDMPRERPTGEFRDPEGTKVLVGQVVDGESEKSE